MIYAYREQNDAGNYQTADGARFMVYTAASLHGAVRDCWQEFESLAAALAAWGLEPLPSTEEMPRMI